MSIAASDKVVAHLAVIANRKYLFIANFDGLKAGEVATPRTQHDVAVTLDAAHRVRLHVLPFLGQVYVLDGVPVGGGMRFMLPQLGRGAVVWQQ